ncbi:Ig-like domain-containing protein [Methanobrevibacter sp.]|uniref:Ig-like domain-containing protein n=1 Tax=Methanobrevibacter sp. TaxID=66852 RepID=UPI0025D6DDFF|nr:Ig-like domain-containing protein [Methanobrevibacter sp.]MBQ6511973.1 hypothetical protein [Methanobrevibacter sp.]
MEKNKLIIVALLVIIVALLLGIFAVTSNSNKTDSKLEITSNNTLNEGSNLTVKLTDINGTGISGETVNITITDKDGGSYYTSVITNSSGVGVLELDRSVGNYTVNCSYYGNDNYTGNSTQQKLEIIEQPIAHSSSSYSNDISYTQNDNRPAVDSSGITREEADYWGWEYTTEHGGHYIGSNDHWDENAGMYHD